MTSTIQLLRDSWLEPPAIAIAIFLILLFALLRCSRRLPVIIAFMAVFAGTVVAIGLASWPSAPAVAATHGWFMVVAMTSLSVVCPMLVAGVPVILIDRTQAHLAVKLGVGLVGGTAALVVFPVVGLYAACALGDCI